jgi:uncharacterized membrane protein YkvA (DUF1232 family)
MESKRAENKAQSTPKSERHRLVWNIVFLVAAIVYTVSPMDIIPDLLGPLGFTDDILLWAVIVGVSLLKWLRGRSGAGRGGEDGGAHR